MPDGRHSSEETSQRKRAVGDAVSRLTFPVIEPRPSEAVAMHSTIISTGSSGTSAIFICLFATEPEKRIKALYQSLEFGSVKTKVDGAAAFMIFSALFLVAGVVFFFIGLCTSTQSRINVSAHFLSWAGE